MKISTPLLPLFKKFINDSETGKRLKKNGERITKGTVNNYKYVFQNLTLFSTEEGFDLRIFSVSKLTQREFKTEKNYWKKFYQKFTDFLYKRGCYDNYVGTNIKIIKLFFNYLKTEQYIDTGDFHKMFYVTKEEIDILVLSPDQLKFLMHDKDFEDSLSLREKKAKDVFVFGCTTGLRFSDLLLLTNKNFEETKPGEWYLKLKTKKTKTYSYIKLSSYAVSIYMKYKSSDNRRYIFENVNLYSFNDNLKIIGEKAGYTSPIEVSREIRGKAKTIKNHKNKKGYRFCDKMSSHMMRRTAITTLLLLGMPEHLVRKISGHSNNSGSFNRYVHYAQAYMDKEIQKVHEKLEEYQMK